ncbi:hypothetical protein LU699_15545 [Luteimonas fraxinea]|uniref:hypothetical protein n=1 Tax=Luteimonas fraxinea TaxID=2901869 RepID=UPI001E5F6A3D|nr:hypothetical protein [Luteimonas fraxinea]UHH09657.1 hypothetical protein LU699_15545 [Luteimonas fraxinea]
MPRIWQAAGDAKSAPLQISSLIDHLDSLAGAALGSRLDETAMLLARVAQDRDCIPSAVLGLSIDPKKMLVDNAHVFVLHQTERYLIRLVVWRPTTGVEDEAFLYEGAHDHNFDLMTVGYTGCGYLTDLYSYQGNGQSLSERETVSINRHGRFQLAPGTVLFLSAGCDIHAQHAPDEVSVSINIICYSKKTFPQHLFEIQSDSDLAVVTAVLASREVHNEQDLMNSLEEAHRARSAHQPP